MSDLQTPTNATKNKTRFGSLSIVLILIAVLATWGYLRFSDLILPWQNQGNEDTELSLESVDQRLLETEKNVTQLESERNALQQRLNESANRTNVLRDEILGVTERAALIEQSISALSESEHSAQDNLRINEATLFLTFAKERWQLSGDLAGAVHATELARISIDHLKNPKWLNLRQTITQELNAYRTLDTDPAAIAKGELDALQALLPQLVTLSSQKSNTETSKHGMTRLINALIQVQPTGQQTLISPSERSAARTALALDMTTARMAILLRNSSDFKASILRINQWLLRLYADTPALKERREQLLLVASKPLNQNMPLAGSSLNELLVMQQGSAP